MQQSSRFYFFYARAATVNILVKTSSLRAWSTFVIIMRECFFNQYFCVPPPPYMMRLFTVIIRIYKKKKTTHTHLTEFTFQYVVIRWPQQTLINYLQVLKKLSFSTTAKKPQKNGPKKGKHTFFWR